MKTMRHLVTISCFRLNYYLLFLLVCPEESGKIRSQFDLVELAGEIQTADKFTRATAGSKLSVIAEQVRFLQEQATKILEQAQRDKEINHMACNFKRIPGKLYYIYRQKFHMQKHGEGKPYMSMISPEVKNLNSYFLFHVCLSFRPYIGHTSNSCSRVTKGH